mgnify:CR=1 FL=1
MNKSTRANPVYVALENKFVFSSSTISEPVFEISIDPTIQKINLDKSAARGFLNIDATEAIYTQEESQITIELWSTKNHQLLGTLTSREGHWSTKDLKQIGRELKATGIKYQEKGLIESGTMISPSLSLENVFVEDIQDNTRRSKVAFILVLIRVGFAFLLLTTVFLINQFPQVFRSMSFDMLEYGLKVYTAFKYIVPVFLFIELVALLFWLKRVYTNLSKAGMVTNFSSRYVVWLYVIPLVWWVYPYLVIKEIWRKTQLKLKEAILDYKLRGAILINIWWVISVVTQVGLLYIIIRDEVMKAAVERGSQSIGSYFEERAILRDIGLILLVIMILNMFIFPVIFTRIIKQEKLLYKVFVELKTRNTERKKTLD